MEKIVEASETIVTGLELDGTECAVKFSTTYTGFEVKNNSGSDITVSLHQGRTSGDGVVTVHSGSGINYMLDKQLDTVYITGKGSVDVAAKRSPHLVFPTKAKGGDTQYGENLFNLENFKTTLSSLSEPAPNGNIKWLDNGFTLNATSEDCYTYWQFGSAPAITVKANTLYELSFDVNGAYGTNYMFFESPPSTNKMINFSNHNSKFVFRTISGTTKLTLRFGVSAAGTSCTFTNIKLRQIL